MNSSVSVIIPSYNSAKFLPEAIESVLRQTYPVSEIIVVDDGSTDETKQVCDRYPKVKYIYQQNQGVSAARNTGICASKGDYLIFLDSDDRLLPQAVEIGVDCINDHPEVGFVFGRYEYKSINPDGSYTIENTYDNQPEIANYTTLLACEHEIQCGCVVFRRDAVESVNGFDPNIKYMEDQNLFLRVAYSFPIYFHNQIVSEYRVTGSNVSGQPAKMLTGALRTHSLQWSYIEQTGNQEYVAAYQRGRQYWIKLFVERLPYEIMRCTQGGQWIEALGHLGLLLNYDPKLQYLDKEIYAVAYKTLLAKLRKLPIASSLAYWKQQLAGASPLLSLPTDRPRPAEQTFQGATQSFIVSTEVTQALSLLSRNQGVTLFMTLLAAYNTLLYRYTGTEDIIVGSPIATYINSQLFVNGVVLRSDMSGNPSFGQLLERVRKVTLLCQSYQDLPYFLLVDELGLQPDPSYPPLFQVTFLFEENIDLQKLDLSTLSASPWVLENNQGKYDLTLFLKETENLIQGQWVYNTDLFDAGTIERLNSHFQTLLQGIITNPEQSISEFPLLTAKEKKQLLIEWNQTQVEYPRNQFIHQLIADQAEKKPEAIAVVFEDQQLTYRELNNKANCLAHYLRSLGIGTEAIVGIFVEKSLDLIVTVLGILKSGAAYLPLDPSYPSDRLEFMLADASPSVIITISRLKDNLPSHNAQVICLDLDQEILTQQSRENPSNQTQNHSLTYIIYTSGSTGKPKGVMIEQSSLVNAYLAWEEAYHLTTDTSSHLQMASFSFDVFAGDFVRALCSGAKLVLCPRDLLLESKQLYALMRQEKVDCAEFVPAVLRNLVEYLERSKQNLDFMKVLAAGSDSWYLSEYKQIKSLCGSQTRLINSYGVSEVTIDSTYFETDLVDLAEDASNGESQRLIPIGRPFPNTQIYILDQYQQPVPIGVPGELHIGGAGVARGYLNRPDLTDSKFIPNPFKNSSERLYKTGDLVRYLADGNIEFVGRIDYQVKIRGFRVELGEIEALLSQHPEIRETAVIIREDIPGDKRIVACIVCNPEPAPTVNDLRDFLSQHLPNFMIPSAFVMLDALPITPNGKIDRRALLTHTAPNSVVAPQPTPTTNQADSKILQTENTSPNNLDTSIDAPRNATESALVGIWQQVLGLDIVRTHDNFFALGGHSLLAAKVIVLCYQAFSIELSLRDLFVSPTIAGLAEIIERSHQQEVEVSHAQIIPRRTNQNSAPLSLTQQRLWFLHQLEPNRTDYLFSIAVRLTGSLNLTALQKSLDAIVERNETLRTKFISEDGNPIQVICEPQTVELQLINLQDYPATERERESEVMRRLQQVSDRPFNLSQDLMLRAYLFNTAPQEHTLLLVIHHIAFDGWSEALIWQELSSFYKAFSQGLSPSLPELPIQYADFAVWQRQQLSDQKLENQLQYWKQQLTGINQVLELPTDYSRPPIQTNSGSSEFLIINQSLTTSLKALCRQQGVTLFIVLMAAFQILLFRHSGQEDFMVGSPIAGRDRTEVQKLIGFFLNTLVIKADLSGNPSFQELLGRVRDISLGAYGNQDLPFEKLIEELKPNRDLSRNPLFQVMFNMLNFEETKLEMTGLTVDPVLIPENTAKFDLTVYANEQNNKIEFLLVYKTDLFSQERTAEMLRQFEQLLEQIVAQPEKPIQSYSLVTATSKALLPDPSIALAEPEQEPITNIFINWANQTSTHPAIIQDKHTYTYGELAATAQKIAQILQNHHIKKGEVVAVTGLRSFGLIASMLGVLMSGGVLLNIDTTLPKTRKQLMLTTSKVKYLLNVGTTAPEIELTETSITIITINPQIGIDSTSELEYTPVHISVDDSAYIFFTSGTTGTPKGVLGTHKGLSHFLTWQRQTFDITPQDRAAQLTGLSFDVVLRDIFLPLTSGATLCLPSVEDDLRPGQILPWMEKQQITLLHTVPTLAESWLMYLPAGVSLKTLRRVFFAGEPLTDSLIRKWRAAFPETDEIINLYGPTETTLAKFYYRVPKENILPGVQPVGRPLPQTQPLVLTVNHQLCGIGESGEIIIRTPFRTQGYINVDPGQLSKFAKNPFTEDDTDLVYYTGDRGRYRLDGTLEILGRIDQQIKIRGVRIEPGEISATINQNSQVKASVVIAREDISGDKKLVAYVVPENQQDFNSTELRQFLKQSLPDYMIPSAFVTLEALPVTANGKIDKRALPIPTLDQQQLERNFVTPRNDIEKQLVAIWEKVLGVQPIGITDNFFALGGHSLLAIRLFAEIEKNLRKNLPLVTLFQAQTVEELAGVMTARTSPLEQESLVIIQPGISTKPPLFCVHAIWGNVFFYRNLASHLKAEQPFYALQSRGLDGKQPPLTSVYEMATNYVQEIKTIQPHGPYFIGGFSLGSTIALEMAQQLKKQGEEIALLAVFDQPIPNYTHQVNSDHTNAKPQTLSKQIFSHLENLMSLKLQGQFNYIQGRLNWHLTVGKVSTFYKLYLRYIQRSLSDIRLLEVAWANDQARKNYAAQTYPGKVTLFRATGNIQEFENDSQLGWDQVASGGVETYEFPGATHTTLMEEPNVKLLAEKLTFCIQQSQRNISASVHTHFI